MYIIYIAAIVNQLQVKMLCPVRFGNSIFVGSILLVKKKPLLTLLLGMIYSVNKKVEDGSKIKALPCIVLFISADESTLFTLMFYTIALDCLTRPTVRQISLKIALAAKPFGKVTSPIYLNVTSKLLYYSTAYSICIKYSMVIMRNVVLPLSWTGDF